VKSDKTKCMVMSRDENAGSSKETGLVMKADKTKCMVKSRDENAG
jgi:hypothetical protein